MAKAEADKAAMAAVVEEEAEPEPEPTQSPSPRRAADDLFQAEDFALPPVYARDLAEAPATYEAAPLFQVSSPGDAVAAIDPDAFLDSGYDATLLAMIRAVVNQEGPVRDDVLAKRIARAHGWSRTGGRIHDRVLALAEREFPLVRDGESFFVWPSGVAPAHWPSFRRPAGDEPRPVDEIALPELAALVREVKAKGLDGEAALTAMARIAGLQKLRQASRERFEAAWRMVEDGE